MSKQRPPLTSDAEHARTIDPVLTRGAAVWIQEARPLPPLTVIGGRAFTYRDVDYDPLDSPVLKVRPIDGQQVVPFLARIVLGEDERVPENGVVTVSFPAPNIFDARLDHLSAWVGASRVQPSSRHVHDEARIDIRVPLTAEEAGDRRAVAVPIVVILEGELELGGYEIFSPARFTTLEDARIDPAIEALARLETARDVVEPGELDVLGEVADVIVTRSSTAYERVLAVNSWVGNRLQYREGPATRSAIEALEDRSGDCDEYTILAVALLRALGIPARRAGGLLYNLDTLAAHAWVEVALPTGDGDFHWFIVDPTLAGATQSEERKREFVQFRDRMLLYPMKPTVTVEGMAGRFTTDILFNWRKPREGPPNDRVVLGTLLEQAITEVDRSLSRGAERLAEQALRLRRDSSSIPGSPYLFIDRPLADDDSTTLQLRLENEERLVLELTANQGSALESKLDLETIDRLRVAYADLEGLFFDGYPAHRNLELLYHRDRHSDRLQAVSLRVGRYLVEHFLDRIVKKLSKLELLTDEEAATISDVAEASDGRNLYVLQELARRVPSGGSP